MLRLFALLILPLSAAAESPLRFIWKASETHRFTVRQETTVSETAADKSTSVTRTKLTLAKTWSVDAVDVDGTATLSLKITAIRNEITRPVPQRDGKLQDETTIIDSATPEGAQAVADYLNKTLLTVRVDTRGRVSEVRASGGDAAARLQAELPFRVILPEGSEPKWEREFAIRLDPPAGTGEKHDAVQSFSREKIEGARTWIRVSTSLKSPPKEVAELQPLLPWLWEGTIEFDVNSGTYLGAKLTIEREYPNHAGVGTRFVFSSRFEESRVEK